MRNSASLTYAQYTWFNLAYSRNVRNCKYFSHWQWHMKSVLQDLSQVRNFFDNGCFDDGQKMVQNFRRQFCRTYDSLGGSILKRMRSHDLRLNRTKCVFATTSVEFLSHKIDAQGIWYTNRINILRLFETRRNHRPERNCNYSLGKPPTIMHPESCDESPSECFYRMLL